MTSHYPAPNQAYLRNIPCSRAISRLYCTPHRFIARWEAARLRQRIPRVPPKKPRSQTDPRKRASAASREIVAIRRRIERQLCGAEVCGTIRSPTSWPRWQGAVSYEEVSRCGVPRWRCALRPQYALVKTQPVRWSVVSFAYYKHRLMCEGKMYRCTLGVYPPAERLVFSLSPSKTSSLGYYQCQGGLPIHLGFSSSPQVSYTPCSHRLTYNSALLCPYPLLYSMIIISLSPPSMYRSLTDCCRLCRDTECYRNRPYVCICPAWHSVFQVFP